jgi:hypothetical protein
MLRIENLTIYFRRRNVMKLANKAYFFALTLLILAFTVSAFGQTTTTTTTARSAKDPRNTAPTAGTGGSSGGPTGLFTVYDGQTLRRGEYTFSAAFSNYDRDPGNADITDVPLSFQIGLTNRIELFFNTNAYRGIKINSPRNLSSFSLPNSQVRIGAFVGSAPAIILAPQGPGVSLFPNQAVFRPTGSQPFVQFPYVPGSNGNFGFPFNIGTVFGFPVGPPLLGPPRPGGKGADEFPGVGSVFGSILPGVVFQTTTITPPGNRTFEIPTSFATAPSYLPDAPFVNRTWGESAFNTFTGGVKWRFTGITNPIGVGVVAYYTWNADHAKDFQGFNQLQRGASAGGNRGDISVFLFADSRVSKHFNLSANLGYTWNSDVKGEFPNGKFTLLDRADELNGSVGADFPINRYFQPIFELRALRYVGGHTPNAFPQNPIDGIAGFRIYPARWMSIGLAYRYNFNEQDEGYFDDNDTFNQAVLVPCFTVATQVPGGVAPPPCFTVQTSSIRGVPPGFTLSEDPHGYIVQFTVGRRNKRAVDIPNHPADVTALNVSDTDIQLPCPPGFRSTSGGCNDSTTINVTTTAVDPDNDVLTYNYTVSGGRVVGQGASVQWDLSGVSKGTYTITAGVDDGCGICGKTMTQSVNIGDCPDCVKVCECPSVSISGPAGITNPGDAMTFTANVSGGSQDTVTYNWTVSAGTIESGQGTPSITVRTTREMAGGNVTATLTIGGPAPACGCTTTFSETAGVSPAPSSTQVDTFGPAKDDDVKARVDNFYTQLNANPNSQGYIINYGTPAEIKRRRAQIVKAINFRKYDPSRVTFVDGPDKGTGIETHFYLVPPGAENPQP